MTFTFNHKKMNGCEIRLSVNGCLPVLNYAVHNAKVNYYGSLPLFSEKISKIFTKLTNLILLK